MVYDEVANGPNGWNSGETHGKDMGLHGVLQGKKAKCIE